MVLAKSRGAPAERSAFENDLRDRLFRGVRNRQGSIFHTEFEGELSRPSMEGHGGPTARQADNLAIAPPYAVIPSGSKSFHGGFLGGEARGVTLHAICLGIAISNLSRGEDTLQKALPEALDGLANARDFGDVDARAYDHVRDA